MPNPAPGFRKRPDHRIRIEPAQGRVVVTFAGRTVADSRRALVMQESGYPPIHYIPEADLDTGLMRPSERTTHCPFKGDASYRTLEADGRVAEDASGAIRRRSTNARRLQAMPPSTSKRSMPWRSCPDGPPSSSRYGMKDARSVSFASSSAGPLQRAG